MRTDYAVLRDKQAQTKCKLTANRIEANRQDLLMSKVRVLVANQPRLMRELVVSTLSAQNDIEVAGEAHNDDEVRGMIDEIRPDCVIIKLSASNDDPDLLNFLIQHYPQIRVVAIAPESNQALYYAPILATHRFDISEQNLLGVLRGSLFSDVHNVV